MKNDFKKWDTSPTEKAHLRFCKIYLGLGKKASNLATRGELGKFPLIISIFKRLFNYITHLNSLPESTIAKQAFLLSKDLYQQNKTFYGNTTNILKSYIDQSQITDLESITPQSLDLITQNIQQSYTRFWKGQIEHTHTLKNFRNRPYKSFFAFLLRARVYILNTNLQKLSENIWSRDSIKFFIAVKADSLVG